LTCVNISLVRLSDKVVSVDLAPFSEQVESTASKYTNTVKIKRKMFRPKKTGYKNVAASKN